MTNWKNGGFIPALTLGAIVGVVLGLLFAPRPGWETRAELRAKAEKVVQKAQEPMAKAREMVGKVRERKETLGVERSDSQ